MDSVDQDQIAHNVEPDLGSTLLDKPDISFYKNNLEKKYYSCFLLSV